MPAPLHHINLVIDDICTDTYDATVYADEIVVHHQYWMARPRLGLYTTSTMSISDARVLAKVLAALDDGDTADAWRAIGEALDIQAIVTAPRYDSAQYLVC